jgi:hypothetical protein
MVAKRGRRKKAKRPKRSGGGNSKGRNALSKIVATAKQIRKRSPGIEWKSAIKQASSMYRRNK